MLNDQELVQLKTLLDKYEPVNKDAVIKTVSESAHEVFQTIHDQGHSAATVRADKKIVELTTQNTVLSTKVQEQETQLKDIGMKTPNLQEMQDRHARTVQDLQDKHKRELEVANTRLQNERTENATQLLAIELVGLGVDKEYATLIMAKKPEIVSRFVPNEAGQMEVMQAGKTIPLVPTAESSAIKLLASELVPTVPTHFKKSKTSRGSGTNGTEGGTEKPETGNKGRFAKAREEAEAASGKAGGSTGRAGLARLGGRATET